MDAFVLDFDWKAWGEELGEFRWNQNKFPNGQSGRLAEILRKKELNLQVSLNQGFILIQNQVNLL
ncbi:hypothetical protein [Caloramator sp. Dgby_cultured_2]|uniref:hypothetical protein n=1 Tax=Caloramator sp. Dgby_cultured_2 TaxID=3029174 RepID=UPI0031590071